MLPVLTAAILISPTPAFDWAWATSAELHLNGGARISLDGRRPEQLSLDGSAIALSKGNAYWLGRFDGGKLRLHPLLHRVDRIRPTKRGLFVATDRHWYRIDERARHLRQPISNEVDAEGRFWTPAGGGVKGPGSLRLPKGHVFSHFDRAEPRGPVVVVTDRRAFAVWKGRLVEIGSRGYQTAVWSPQAATVTVHQYTRPNPTLTDHWLVQTDLRTGSHKIVADWTDSPIGPWTHQLLAASPDARTIVSMRILAGKAHIGTFPRDIGPFRPITPLPLDAQAAAIAPYGQHRCRRFGWGHSSSRFNRSISACGVSVEVTKGVT
jgi:hypothetical protein